MLMGLNIAQACVCVPKARLSRVLVLTIVSTCVATLRRMVGMEAEYDGGLAKFAQQVTEAKEQFELLQVP
jgi:hypothetical protein